MFLHTNSYIKIEIESQNGEWITDGKNGGGSSYDGSWLWSTLEHFRCRGTGKDFVARYDDRAGEIAGMTKSFALFYSQCRSRKSIDICPLPISSPPLLRAKCLVMSSISTTDARFPPKSVWHTIRRFGHNWKQSRQTQSLVLFRLRLCMQSFMPLSL